MVLSFLADEDCDCCDEVSAEKLCFANAAPADPGPYIEGELATVPSCKCINSPPTDELFLEYILLLLELLEDWTPSAAITLPPDAAMAAADVDDVDDFSSDSSLHCYFELIVV